MFRTAEKVELTWVAPPAGSSRVKGNNWPQTVLFFLVRVDKSEWLTQKSSRLSHCQWGPEPLGHSQCDTGNRKWIPPCRAAGHPRVTFGCWKCVRCVSAARRCQQVPRLRLRFPSLPPWCLRAALCFRVYLVGVPSQRPAADANRSVWMGPVHWDL